MEHYELKSDETVLYSGPVELKSTERGKRASSEVILTNFNFVVIVKTKRLFGESVEKIIYDVKDVKFYEQAPQVIRKKVQVDIYLVTGELFLKFPSEKNAREFTDKALRLISGYSKLVRGVKKIQKAIAETDEALDIDIVGSVKTAAEVVGTVAVASEPTSKIGKWGAGLATVLLDRKKKNKELPAPDKKETDT